MAQEIKAYRAEDGRLFGSLEEARQHELINDLSKVLGLSHRYVEFKITNIVANAEKIHAVLQNYLLAAKLLGEK